MKRTKEWWARLTKHERAELVRLERDAKHIGGGSIYLPEDTRECWSCGNLTTWGGLCEYCGNRLSALLRKADLGGLE